MTEVITALIITIATDFGIPPNFFLSLITVESRFNPNAIGYNYDTEGNLLSVDLGLCQVNSNNYGTDWNWQDPKTNLKVGAKHIVMLLQDEKINTWWAVAVAYNGGAFRIHDGNPKLQTIEYANKVMEIYTKLNGGYVNPLVQYDIRKKRWY